ncbi:MAG: DEAD/DEAH box helicase family protein [Bacteroidota bacterium]
MNEANTRRELIDKQLQKAGWKLDDASQVAKEHPIDKPDSGNVNDTQAPYGTRKLFADYVLFAKNGKPIAVVEAKSADKDARTGREQAKNYCLLLQQQYNCELPFCFYSNGDHVYFWDIGEVPPKQVVGYPSRSDLERMQTIRKQQRPLADELINPAIAGRDYQISAIRKVMEGVARRKSKFLLVMATGTGKTRTCIALIDALMRAGRIERTLFLVDRIGLREQAVKAFKEHLPNEPIWPKDGEKSIADDRRIFVATYPAMLNIVRDEETVLSPYFFDLIVIDESHRSIYNTYQEILQYFNTLTLGLTATPTDIIDHNTFQLFDCEDGLPSFAYTYEEAVNNVPPYLANFEVMKIGTRFQNEGINKRTISLDDQMQLIREGKEVAEINYEGTELERTVTNKGTNRAIIKDFWEVCVKDPNGVLPGKTILFCASISHARQVEDIINQEYAHYGDNIARVIVSEDRSVYGKGGLLEQFLQQDMPRIAISVDMLDTGIDLRELVNLVFMKPVYSYTKFWQMIGRGTRLLDSAKIKEWCPVKTKFFIMDCWDNFEYFKLNPKGRELKPTVPLPVRYAKVIIDKLAVATAIAEDDIALKEGSRLQVLADELPDKSIKIKQAKSDIDQLYEADFWTSLTTEKITFLSEQIQPLFATLAQVNFKSMRFRMMVLDTSLALLADDMERYESLKDSLKEFIVLLPLAVNKVARHEDLIRSVLGNRFWQEVTDDDFDMLADTLEPLIYLIETESSAGGMRKLNLSDTIETREMVEFGPENEAVSVSRYREMVESKIRELTATNPILQKLQAEEELSPDEQETLAEELYTENPHITEGLLRRVYQQQQADFLQLIKHILGIEILEAFEEQVSRAVADFIAGHTWLTSRQIDFLQAIKSYILQKGSIEKRNLTEAPFTLQHSKGVLGVFSPPQIKELLKLTEKFAA